MTRDTAERPAVWVGHIHLETPDLAATRDFMLELGMRAIFSGEDVAVLELRGGTHLVLERSEALGSGLAGFDLMVEDLAATHSELESKGFAPSPIEEGRIHRSFTVTSPSGHAIKFNSSHVSDQPV